MVAEGKASCGTVIDFSREVAERFDSSGEIAATIIKSHKHIVYAGTKEHIQCLEKFPIQLSDVYSPPLGGHSGNSSYDLAALLASSILSEMQ
jgi:hypothetical protein